jgi:polar amino acid transport system substrate-binding protein
MKSGITLISCFLLSLSVYTTAAEVITGEQDPWPPFISSDAQSGISVEIVTAAFETQGKTLKMQSAPWARALDNVKNGKTDVLIATWFTQERTSYLVYSDEYMKNEIKFIKRADDPFEYTDMKSLDGKNVGIVRGYGYGDEFLNATNFTKNETKDLIGNLRKLVNKRIDLTLEDEAVASSIMMIQNGVDRSQFAFTKGALSVNPLHVTSGTKNPKSKDLVAAFNKGLKAIKDNGTYAKILAKYGIK